MKLTEFGILLLICFCMKNTLAYNSDDSDAEDEEEHKIAQFAYEVASIAQSKKDANEQLVTQSTDFIPQLLIAEPHGISRINLTKSIRWMVERTENIGGVDYHFARDRMYWSDLSTGRIYSRPLNSKTLRSYDKELFVERSPLTWRPRSIAVDYITDQLYVTDTIENTVHVFDLDNSSNSATFNEFLKNPMDIVVDPSEGYMFIADDTRLVRASLDGKSPEAIVDQSLYFITTVTLNMDKKRIYWSEHSFHRIKSSNYDGSNKRVVLKNERGKVYNLLGTTNIAFYDSELFFYDEAWRNIAGIKIDMEEDKADDDKYRVIYDWLIVRAMRMVHPSLQKRIVNPCANEKCDSEKMCLISAKEGNSQSLGYTCLDPGVSTSYSGRKE